VTRAAVFLDRDGTIIRDTHYVGSEDSVELIPGAAEAIRVLNESGWPVVVVTNQSGIARGYFSFEDYERVRHRVDALLSSYGAHVDGTYACPHHPDETGPCECRKPGTLMHRQAADEYGLDVSRSWYIGDRITDLLPAQELGGGGILVPTDETPAQEVQLARREFTVARTLDEAIRRAIESAK
jgi:D-glycero-D-manno-heptose 1,7-bisphosphate phosphatase